MDARQSAHLGRVRHLREAFSAANERLVARLRAATDEAAALAPGGGWTAAQIGWHVAAVTSRFADVISGDAKGAVPLPDEFVETPWEQIAAAIPARLKAPDALAPPPAATRHDAISALEAAGMRMARAFDTLTPERGSRLGLTSPIVGTITLYQVGEWATAHIIRHNKQAKQALGH